MIMAQAQARFGDPTAAVPVPSLAPATSPSSNPLAVLGSCFQSFISATSNEASWETAKLRILELEEQLHAHGIGGPNSIPILMQLKPHICWESMVPNQFIRFYRFLFHACKEPKRKHMRVEVALQVWELVLAGRFRLLDRWCEFIQGRSHEVRVIGEDQWRQVLDFSRTVHEDLSNFDLNGAWVWLLDDFVEHMKKQRLSRAQHMDCDGFATDMMEPESSRMSPAVSPHCGSKRRSPDIDVVAEQLSAMPLNSGNLDQMLKKHCGAKGLMVSGRGGGMQLGGMMPVGVSGGGACDMDVPPPDLVLQNLPAVQTTNRRTVRTRRSGVSDLVNRIVSDTLGLSAL